MPGTTRVIVARVAVWLLALVSMIVGISLLAKRVVEVNDYGAITLIDVTGVGTALLSVGVLILAALLIAEGYGPTARQPAEPSGASESASG